MNIIGNHPKVVYLFSERRYVYPSFCSIGVTRRTVGRSKDFHDEAANYLAGITNVASV